jgi:hypothetical protein
MSLGGAWRRPGSRPDRVAGSERARRREKGPPRAGNARVRRGMIQSAWRFLIFQKESALAQWHRSQWPLTGKARYKPAPAQAGVYKARNILERLPKPVHACVRKVLRQASELDDADNAERLISNLARRLGQPAPRGAASILEGLDEILTVIRLGLPAEIRRSWPAPTSSKR